MELKIAIGVVLFNNSERQAQQLFQSIDIAARRIPNLNVYLIDNGLNAPRQKFSEIAARYDHNIDSITWFENNLNLGFGKAQNKLMGKAFEAGCDAYICLNPDGFLHRYALERIATRLQGTQGLSLLEMRQIPAEHPKPYDPVTLETPWCSGASLMIPAQIYKSIGGFDEQFFMYCEDVDISWRARLANYSCQIVADAYFYHDFSARKYSRSVEIGMFTSARYLAWKWLQKQHCERFSQHMLKRGFIADIGKLPDLSFYPQISADPAELTKIVDFEHDFNFCEARW